MRPCDTGQHTSEVACLHDTHLALQRQRSAREQGTRPGSPLRDPVVRVLGVGALQDVERIGRVQELAHAVAVVGDLLQERVGVPG